ncbi:hypothetical protein [Acetomicrobium sp.]|nr:hypothetical protein [Acetomicrobium sp.]
MLCILLYGKARGTAWEPLSKDEAMELYEQLPEHEMEFEESFPGEPVEEA